MFRHIPYEKKEKIVEKEDAFLSEDGITLYFGDTAQTWNSKNSNFTSMLSKVFDYLFGYGISINDTDGVSPIYPINGTIKQKIQHILKDPARILFVEKFFAI
jgi:hypothetical protein